MAIKNLTNLWLSPNQYYRGQLRKAAGYSICAVEFDDQGELWDPEQLESTLSHIRDACTAGAEEGSGPSSKTEVIVITFIHGWMHNGTPQDLNLEHFSDLIQRRAAAEKQFAERAGRKPRSIIGVYFAWRGLLWKLPVLKYLTFWSRKTAALRVGQLSCTEAVLRISGAVKSRNNRSQCIFIGHSFGGLILENAICKALLGAIFRTDLPDEVSYCPSDLVVLINPACEAAGAKQFIDILERNKVVVRTGSDTAKNDLPFPMLISITSAGDLATKWAFPLGQFWVTLLKSFRRYPDTGQGLPSQWYLHNHTAGHIPRLQNFEVRQVLDRAIDENRLEFSFEDTSRTSKRKFQIVPRSNRCLAFWLMTVPKEIVPNHSDVFTPGFENMLSSLLQWVNTAVEPTNVRCDGREYNVLKMKLKEKLERPSRST